MSEELIPTGQSFQILYSFCCRMQEQTRRENAFVFLGGENLTELACNSPAHIFMSQQTLVGRWRSDPGKQWSPSDTDTLAFMHLHAAYFSFLEPGGAKIFIQAVLNPFDWRAFCQKVRMIQRDLAPIMNRSWRLRESRTGLSLRRLRLEFGANVLDLDYLLVAIFRMYKAC